ncbi:MAG: lipocalin-like domain-containing protein [Pseudomonadota bacterium]
MDLQSHEPFIGGWKLLAWTVNMPKGDTRQPYGENPSGHIIYSQNGVMSATFMAERRSELGVPRPQLPIEIPKSVAAIKSGHFDPLARAFFFSAITFTAYCGTYSVADGQVTHHVETALIPDWVGTDLVRTFQFDNGRLVLQAEENGVVDRLVWERCG